MSWSLSLYGHAPNDEESEAEETEILAAVETLVDGIRERNRSSAIGSLSGRHVSRTFSHVLPVHDAD